MKPFLMRLDKLAQERFGSRAKLAQAIGLRPDQLQSYFTKDSIPGQKIRPKLEEIGINIIFLDYGEGEMMMEMSPKKEIQEDVLELMLKVAKLEATVAAKDEAYERANAAFERAMDTIERLYGKKGEPTESEQRKRIQSESTKELTSVKIETD